MNISIDTASISDHSAVNLIVDEGQVEHSEALPHIFSRVDQVMSETYFRELLEDPKSEILIAKVNEEVVGFAVMEINESAPFDSLIPRKLTYMNDFGIKNSYQRKGIGRILFEACLEWSKSNDAASLDLNVWEFNKKAIAFYESFGLESSSRKMTLRFK